MQRTPRTRTVWLVALVLALVGATAHGGPAELRRRERPERIWEPGARNRAGADARPIIDAALRDAGLPGGVDANPWRELIAQYWRLDQLAQGEPRSYSEGNFVPNAWFTHGARHFLDLALLITANRDFVRDIFGAQGIAAGEARDQAYRDLLIALIGHDSQQLGFASPNEATRERARIDHPFNGGVATALAYLRAAGTNPAGNQRALMLALAAAGHSKSAVDFDNPTRTANPTGTPPSFTRGSRVMLADILGEVNRRLRDGNPDHVDIALADADRDQVIRDAQRIATVLGAMDSLRERGPGTFGAAPTGETMVYRVAGTGPANRALEVVNQSNNRVVTRLDGVSHRTYVEYNTTVEAVGFNGTRFDIRVNFADPDIPTDARRAQAVDIQRDFARTGFPCVVRFRVAGGWQTAGE